MVVRLSALRTDRLYPQEMLLVLISVSFGQNQTKITKYQSGICKHFCALFGRRTLRVYRSKISVGVKKFTEKWGRGKTFYVPFTIFLAQV